MPAVVDPRQASYSDTPKIDDPSMPHVEDLLCHPAPVVEFPQVICCLMISANCASTENQRCF